MAATTQPTTAAEPTRAVVEADDFWLLELEPEELV